jgi:hypothetical protein
VAPTWRGWCTLAVLSASVSAAVLAPSPAGIGLCVAIAVVLVAAAITVVSVCRRRNQSLWCEATGTPLVPQGEPAQVTLHIAGRIPRVGCLLCVDRSAFRRHRGPMDSMSDRYPPRRHYVAPPPRDRFHLVAGEPVEPDGPSQRQIFSTLVMGVPTGQRGILVSAGAGLWLYDPLGLIGVPLGILPVPSVVVHPVSSRPSQGERPHQIRPALHQGTGSSMPTQSAGNDLIGLRPYQPGDRLSSVHWRAVVGSSPPLVREFGGTPGTPHRLILDDRAGVHRRAAFEAALDALVTELLRPSSVAPVIELRSLASGDALSVVTGSPSPSLLRWLAVVEPRHAVSRHVVAPPRSRELGAGDVIITTSTGAGSLSRLRQAGAHLVVVE